MSTPRRTVFPDAERPKILSASQSSLWKTEGIKALSYLRDERHLSEEVIRRFQFGYCPPNSQHELAGRIIMPTFDSQGNLIAFTTRNPWAPKEFQHWHESFDKTNSLYGLHIAKQSMRRTDEAIVVEGQFDVTYAHTAHLDNTVGLCGSAFTIMHASILARYCSFFYLILDPDKAGEDGVTRAIKMLHQYNLKNYGLYFIPIKLPEELDPDEFLHKHGKHALLQMMKVRKEQVING